MKQNSGAFLGIDIGTTNIKAQIVEEDGTIVSSGSAPVDIQYSSDGAAEQDIGEIWTATCAAVRQASVSGAGARVQAVGISSQGGALQVLDPAGRPVGRVIGWQDSRGARWDRELTARLGSTWCARHTGYPRTTSAVGQLLRLRERGGLPQGYRVGWVGDVIVGRLCGRRAHDGTSLSEACLFNPGVGTEDRELLEELGLTKERLPDLLGVDQPAAGLLSEVARSLQLPAGVPVGPAVHDQYAAAAGCGAVHGGDTMLGAGTAWVLLAVTETLEPPVGGVALVGRHPVPGLYGQMLSMVNGGGCITWAVKALNLGSPGTAEIDGLLASVPAGSSGLRFRPLLSEVGGAALPAGTAGRLDGLRLSHTPGHVLRALIEGLACELGRYLRLMDLGGVAVKRLVMCGKAAASTVTPGIIADTTGVPVDCVKIPETSSLGAAILARGLVEKGAGLAALADSMKPPLRRVEPGPGTAAGRAMLDEYIDSLPAAPGR